MQKTELHEMKPENMSPIPVIEPEITPIPPERELKETKELIRMDLVDLAQNLEAGRVDLAIQRITDLLYNWHTYSE